MNVVALVGNVASEPELRVTSGGKSCCSFRLAVSRVGTDQADFLTVVAWERQAEVCDKYLDIGRRIAVDGRLRHTTWKADDGSSRSRVEVVANRIDFLGPRLHRERTEEAAAPVLDGPGSASADAGHEEVGTTDEHERVFGYDPAAHADVFEQVAELA